MEFPSTTIVIIVLLILIIGFNMISYIINSTIIGLASFVDRIKMTTLNFLKIWSCSRILLDHTLI